MISETLRQYIESEILPRYNEFDAAHRRDHADMVIAQSMEIAQHYDVDKNMVYAIAAYHDTGLARDRKTHHLVSGEIVRGDGGYLKLWFPESPNVQRLEALRAIIRDESLLREKFEMIYERLTSCNK